MFVCARARARVCVALTIFGGLTAQVDWLGLRVGGHPALSLHSSNAVLKFGRIPPDLRSGTSSLRSGTSFGDPAHNVSGPPPIMSDQHNIELNEF